METKPPPKAPKTKRLLCCIRIKIQELSGQKDNSSRRLVGVFSAFWALILRLLLTLIKGITHTHTVGGASAAGGVKLLADAHHLPTERVVAVLRRR